MNLEQVLQMMEEDCYYATCSNPECRYEQEVEVDGGGHTCHECEKGKMINPMRNLI